MWLYETFFETISETCFKIWYIDLADVWYHWIIKIIIESRNFCRKIFPGQILSGFLPNSPVSYIFKNLWFRYVQNVKIWWSLMSLMLPGRPGPVFWQKSGFLKTIFLKSTHHEKFFDEIISRKKIVRDPVFPKLTDFPHFL